jgi:hypothetical protein
VSNFKEFQIQFEQALDGGYRFLDRCGEFMSLVRDAFEFMPVSVNPSGCNMEAPESALRLQVSTDLISLVCTNTKNVDTLLRAANFISEKALNLFEPFAIEHNRLISHSIWQAATVDESFKKSVTRHIVSWDRCQSIS